MKLKISKSFTCLLVNGDSYTAAMQDKLVYADVLGEMLGVPVINIAQQGSNNDRILRSTIEKVIELTSQGQTPLVIVAWSFIRRIEVWYYGDNKNVIIGIPDRTTQNETQNPRFVTLDFLLNKNEATIEQKCLINDDLFVHKQLTDFYTKMYLLANTFDNFGVKWFMFSGAKNTEIPIHCFPYIQSLEQVKWCQAYPNIYNMHEFCIPNWAENNDADRSLNTGHLSETGHKKFASTVFEWLRSVNNV
jgi:hypothetical protein